MIIRTVPKLETVYQLCGVQDITCGGEEVCRRDGEWK